MFTIEGGDATVGTLPTMYDGSRPDANLAGRCGSGKGHNGRPITLQKCTEGSSSQTCEIFGLLEPTLLASASSVVDTCKHRQQPRHQCHNLRPCQRRQRWPAIHPKRARQPRFISMLEFRNSLLQSMDLPATDRSRNLSFW